MVREKTMMVGGLIQRSTWEQRCISKGLSSVQPGQLDLISFHLWSGEVDVESVPAHPCVHLGINNVRGQGMEIVPSKQSHGEEMRGSRVALKEGLG